MGILEYIDQANTDLVNAIMDRVNRLLDDDEQTETAILELRAIGEDRLADMIENFETCLVF